MSSCEWLLIEPRADCPVRCRVGEAAQELPGCVRASARPPVYDIIGIRLPRSADPHEADNGQDDKTPFHDQTHRTDEVAPVTHITRVARKARSSRQDVSGHRPDARCKSEQPPQCLAANDERGTYCAAYLDHVEAIFQPHG